MNIFSVSSIFIIITSSIMALLIVLKSDKRKQNTIWGLFCVAVAIWGLGAYGVSISLNKQMALFWWQIGYSGCIFTNIFYAHFIYQFLNIENKKLFRFIYFMGIVFLFFTWFDKSKLFIGDLRFVFNQFYWTDWLKNKQPIWLIYYIGFCWILLGHSFLLLLKRYKSSVGLYRNQLKYFILGSIFGWFGAHGDYSIALHSDIYPYSNFLIALYAFIFAFAIIKYRLMDIKIIITRTGLFLTIYTLVLGIPFYVGYTTHSWIISTFLAVLLASVGPIFYRIIQKKTEDLLLSQQRRYQKVLLKAAGVMLKEYRLARLLKWIVSVMRRTIGIKYAAIFLEDREQKVFTLRAKRGSGSIPEELAFSFQHPFIVYINQRKEPFFYEELPSAIRQSLNIPFEINVIIPSFIENRNLGFLVLGEKEDRTSFSFDDINVFKILAYQAGLAIENAILYENLQNESEMLKQSIAERKEVQGKIIHAAQEWRTTFDSITQMISIQDRNYNIVRVNRAFSNLFKMKPQDVIGKKCYELMHSSDKPKTDCPHQRALEIKAPVKAEYYDSNLNIYLQIIVSPIFDQEGEVVNTVHIAEDITVRKKVESALRQSEMNLLEAQRIAHIGNWIWYIETNGIEWSEEIYRIFGLRPKESNITFDSFLDYAHPDDRESIRDLFNNALKDNRSFSINHRIVRPDGSERIVNQQIEPLRDKNQKIISMMGTLQDVTENKKMEEMQRLVQLGKLVADMAHEVNNPLMIISGRTQLSLMEEINNEEVKKNLNTIFEQTQRAKDIIQRLLKFSKPSKKESSVVDINSCLDFVIQLIEHQYSLTNIKMIKNYTLDIPKVKIDEKQMQEVFINLLKNAAEAMPEEGSITITTSIEGHYIRLDFTDTGMGIDEKNLNKIFNPFFTTKEKGTGLGLSVCYGIIKAHNGNLKYSSKIGQGTTASVFLPYMTIDG
ncbi:PAS domain S-box protein [Candidatus Omnitrophota bacterium]